MYEHTTELLNHNASFYLIFKHSVEFKKLKYYFDFKM